MSYPFGEWFGEEVAKRGGDIDRTWKELSNNANMKAPETITIKIEVDDTEAKAKLKELARLAELISKPKRWWQFWR